MEFATDKKTFLAELQKVCPIADQKNPMAILSYVLITTAGQYIRLSATNLYLAVNTVFPAVVKTPGTIAVPAATLLDIIRSLPDASKIAVSLDKKGSILHIHTTRIKLKVNTLPGDSFPDLPSPPKATGGELSIAALNELITRTHYAVSSDDARPHLTNLLLTSDGKTVTAIGCDSIRMAKAWYKVDKNESPFAFSMTIPLPGILELKRLIDTLKDTAALMKVSTGGQNAFFRYKDLMFSIRLSTEEFPSNVGNLVPSANLLVKVDIDRELFADALRRINLFSGEGSNTINVNLTSGTITITSGSAIGEGVEKIKVDYKGAAVGIGFNATYLLDMLKALKTNEVVFSMSKTTGPATVTSPGYIGVVMPLT